MPTQGDNRPVEHKFAAAQQPRFTAWSCNGWADSLSNPVRSFCSKFRFQKFRGRTFTKIYTYTKDFTWPQPTVHVRVDPTLWPGTPGHVNLVLEPWVWCSPNPIVESVGHRSWSPKKSGPLFSAVSRCTTSLALIMMILHANLGVNRMYSCGARAKEKTVKLHINFDWQ